MNRDQFMRDLRKYCRTNGLPAPTLTVHHGKGGHGQIEFGRRRTTIPSGELKAFTKEGILKQLGLPKGAL